MEAKAHTNAGAQPKERIMTNKPNLWAAGVIPLVALIWLAPPTYQCYVQSDDKPPCYDGNVDDPCTTNCPNCDIKVTGTVRSRGERYVVRDARTGEKGRVETMNDGRCTYPCGFTCPKCEQEITVDLRGAYYHVEPHPYSAECVGK